MPLTIENKSAQKSMPDINEIKTRSAYQKQASPDDVLLTKEQYDRLVKHLHYVENHLNQYEQFKHFDFETFTGEDKKDNEDYEKEEMNIKQKDDENYFIDENDEENHEIIKKIGEGATSIAYKIFDRRTSQFMCKKVVKKEEGKNGLKTAQNSMKEFEVLHTIYHPCICHSIGINMQEKIPNDSINIINTNSDSDEEVSQVEDSTTIALFLELLEIKLQDCLLDKMFSNTMKVKVAFAMDFIHKLGMIHRDLKIENIMLNSGLEAKVIDFDLVHVDDNVFDNTQYSMTKGIGTLAYMSPEMQNEDEYNNKTDVYSFGVVLHVLFTGKILKQKMNDKLAKVPPKLPSPSSSISKECIELIRRCLSFEPSDRPSFDEILEYMQINKFNLASEVDSEIISRRYRELKRFNTIHIKSLQNK